MRDHAVELFYAVERTLIKYLRGQFVLCTIMGVIGWAIAFFVIGKYSLVIGLWVGLTEIIPILGAFLGAVPAVLIALFVGGFYKALIVAGLFLVAQQLEGNILVPRIQGGSVGVHPLWVLFATLAGTALYGLVGAIFAVPSVAIVAATLRYLRGTVIFERWGKPPVVPATEERRSYRPQRSRRLHRWPPERSESLSLPHREPRRPFSIKDSLRQLLHPLVRLLSALQVRPDTLTILGWTLSVCAAVLFGLGYARVAGLVMLLGGLFDALDGDVARASNRMSAFGAFLDSTLDRLSEAAILSASSTSTPPRPGPSRHSSPAPR